VEKLKTKSKIIRQQLYLYLDGGSSKIIGVRELPNLLEGDGNYQRYAELFGLTQDCVVLTLWWTLYVERYMNY